MPGTFRDVFGATHLDAIERMADAGIVRGYPDGTFRPSSRVTRDQMDAFLVRARGLDTDGCSLDGTVAAEVGDSPHASAICAVLDAGIADGYEDGTYRAEVVISRAQMAAVLARALRN